jgi:chromosome segregation ATPase
MAEKDEIQKLKEENQLLKERLTPLSDTEKARYQELHGIMATTLTSDKDFEKLKTEFQKLQSRMTVNRG